MIPEQKREPSILAGGDRTDYEACLPLFEAMGTNINYQGKAGCGQHCKLANQIMIAGALSGVCEALAYARAKGLNLETVLKSVSTGAAGRNSWIHSGRRFWLTIMRPAFL